jgi:hypothetical protein
MIPLTTDAGVSGYGCHVILGRFVLFSAWAVDSILSLQTLQVQHQSNTKSAVSRDFWTAGHNQKKKGTPRQGREKAIAKKSLKARGNPMQLPIGRC